MRFFARKQEQGGGFKPRGSAVLDAAAFETRLFRHNARDEAPTAFVAAPAFIWSGAAGVTSGRLSAFPVSYTVCGVYSVDRRTLDLWKSRESDGPKPEIRVFASLPQAMAWAQTLNRATADRYAADLSKGTLSSMKIWKACAVERFRLSPFPEAWCLAQTRAS